MSGHPDVLALAGGHWVARGGIQVWIGSRPSDDPPPNQYGRAACGTNGGYINHIRYSKTRPCDDCRAAHTAEERRRRENKRLQERRGESAA